MSRTATFNVNLTQASLEDVYVSYQTINESAKSGSDFSSASGTIHFAPSEISKSVNVTVQAVSDRSLFFKLKMSSPVNAKLTTSNSSRCEIKADNALVALVASAQNKLNDYEAALSAKASADTALASATTTYNNAVTAYNNATTDLNNANAALNTSTTNANNAYSSYNSNLSAYYLTKNPAFYAAAMAALNDYNTWNAQKSQDQDWVNRATTAKNSAQTAKDNALTAKNNAQSATNAAASNVTTKYNLYTPAYNTAKAGFVGSTKIQF
jgi:hypothetical protein